MGAAAAALTTEAAAAAIHVTAAVAACPAAAGCGVQQGAHIDILLDGVCSNQLVGLLQCSQLAH